MSESNTSRTVEADRPAVSISVMERSRLKDEVITRLRDLVASGHYAPGAKLPSERALRDQLGVGRSTIREALRALEAMGLISLQQGRGAFVTEAGAEGAQRGAMPFADWAARSPWKIEDVVEVRLTVETRTAALAALRRTQEDLAAMRRQLDDFQAMAAVDDMAGLVRADVAFHEAIAASANPVYLSLLRSLRDIGVRSRETSLVDRDRWPRVIQRHESLHDAIAIRDPRSAADRMRRHLLDFATELQVTMPPDGEWTPT